MKCGADGLVDDALRDRIGHRAFQTVADFDARASIVLRDEQDRTVVDALAAELPLLRDANAELLDFLGLRRRHDQHRDLAAFFRLEGRELCLDAIDRAARTACR